MLLRLFLSLCLITVISAINCYNGAVYNNSAAPKEQQSCPLATYCTKITAVMPAQMASYGCDQSASLCKTTNCYDNQNGGKTCCCATELCNLSVTYPIGPITVLLSLVLL